MLVDLWAELLGRPRVPVRQTFSSLGGSARLVADMIERVEQLVGMPVPSEARSGDVTIIELALAIQSQGTSWGRPDQPDLIVRNRPRSGAVLRSELFFLHGDLNGGGFYCLALAGHIGKDQPFYGLGPHGLGGTPLPPSIGAMAEDHLLTVRMLKPHGPYRLAGYCNGALVAFEMAQRLQAAGEIVERLVLVSPRLPITRRSGRTGTRRWLGLSRAWRLRTPAHGLRSAFSLTFARRAWRRGTRHLRGASGAPSQDHSLGEAYGAVMSSYTPGPYEGPLILLWPEGEDADERALSLQLWRRAVPRLESRLVPGRHLTTITTHARALAEAIRAGLDRDPIRPSREGGLQSDAPAANADPSAGKTAKG
ncbi:MAG TPA: thioesterase domain-containing protein [Candidatus Methylomirabilis sp.]|nr:thioesterase domain-containing protein [Candidatus Methylomirabilis sp.]